MKKLLLILLLFFMQFSSWSQGRTIKTTSPCNDEVLYKTPGQWFKYTDVWQTDHIAFNKSQQQEVSNRVDKIHAMMQKIYAEPMGLDVAWKRTLGYATFGEQVRYVKNSQGDLTRETGVEKPVASFGYVAGFFRHFCATDNIYEIWSGYPGETGTWFEVFANALAGFAAEPYGGVDNMLIGGYPVHLRQPLKQKFDDYELFYSKANVDNPSLAPEMYVMVHRKGELPYIPVTRKQYLDECIPYLTKWHDKAIKDLEKMPMRSLAEQEAEKNQTIEKMKKEHGWNPPGLKAAIDYYLAGYKTEQEIRKVQLAELVKFKNSLLKRYRDAREETTKHGLLDSPAIIPVTIYNQDEYNPIFVEENIGWMVVIENPKYMRNELPKYVPQFFSVHWKWNEWKSQADVGKLIEEKFPFEKLQAMIDK